MTVKLLRRRLGGVLRLLAAAAALALVPGATAAYAAGTVVLTDQTWTCNGPQDGTVVDVTVTANADIDGVHLDAGCTGRLTIHVTTSGGDGVKVHDGAHDLMVTGSVVCLARYPGRHQDGVQAMGGGPAVQFGDGVVLGSFVVTCPTGNNGGLWIDQGKELSAAPPTGIVCDHCDIYEGNVAVHVRNATASGARNSLLRTGTGGASPHAGCTRLEPATVTLPRDQAPIDDGNTCVAAPAPFGTGPPQSGPGGVGALPTPVLLSSIVSPTRLKPQLRWSAIPGATVYLVFRRGVLVARTTVTSYSDAGLAADGSYAYSVTASGPGGMSIASAPVTVVYDHVAPAAPRGLTGPLVTAVRPRLRWNAVADASGYRIYRNGRLLTTLTQTAYVDAALTADGRYAYAVSALDAAGNEGTRSAAVSVVYATSGPALRVASARVTRIPGGWRLTVVAAVSDSIAVKSVSLLAGGQTLRTDTVAPWVFVVDLTRRRDLPAAVGLLAIDAAGNQRSAGMPLDDGDPST